MAHLLSPTRSIALTDAQLADRKAEPYEYPCYKDNGFYESEPGCRQLCCVKAFGGTPHGQGTPKWEAKVTAHVACEEASLNAAQRLSPAQLVRGAAEPQVSLCFSESVFHEQTPGCDKRVSLMATPMQPPNFEPADAEQDSGRKPTPSSCASSYASSSFSPSDEPDMVALHGRRRTRAFSWAKMLINWVRLS